MIPMDNKENTSGNNNGAHCDFQTPAKRDRAIVVTPPETPSKNDVKVNRRKRQRIVKPLEDTSLFLPDLGDYDSPARFPRLRTSESASMSHSSNQRPCRTVPSMQLPMMPEEFQSPVVIKLAPRFSTKRIMDLASDLSPSKRLRLTPTATEDLAFPLFR